MTEVPVCPRCGYPQSCHAYNPFGDVDFCPRNKDHADQIEENSRPIIELFDKMWKERMGSGREDNLLPRLRFG